MSATVNGVNGVNGAAPHSAFIEHLCQYPVVHDGISTVRQNKYGQQTIAISSSALGTLESLAKPVLPYLAKPLEYVSPYVLRADSLGDRTLDTIEHRFPAVLKPTSVLYEETKDIVLFPVRVGHGARDHVLNVYTGERKQIPGDGVVPLSRALTATAITVTGETLALVRQYLAYATSNRESSADRKNHKGQHRNTTRTK